MTTETHRHHFQIADIGAYDLDQDRSIVPEIHNVLKHSGITAVVDGDEMNQAAFTVWTYSDREVVQEILQLKRDQGLELDAKKVNEYATF
jgi:hypothetical protein